MVSKDKEMQLSMVDEDESARMAEKYKEIQLELGCVCIEKGWLEMEMGLEKVARSSPTSNAELRDKVKMLRDITTELLNQIRQESDHLRIWKPFADLKRENEELVRELNVDQKDKKLDTTAMEKASATEDSLAQRMQIAEQQLQAAEVEKKKFAEECALLREKISMFTLQKIAKNMGMINYKSELEPVIVGKSGEKGQQQNEASELAKQVENAQQKLYMYRRQLEKLKADMNIGIPKTHTRR